MSTGTATIATVTTSYATLVAPGGIPPRTKNMLLAEGQLAAGAVVGRVLGTPTAAAASNNTAGSGTIGAVTLGPQAKAGVYRAVCVEPAANAGTFLVEDPDGVIIGTAIVGAPFSGAVGFTIADAADFVAGDAFLITVPYEPGNVVKLSAVAATDGSQVASAILALPADASEGPVECIAYTRGRFIARALSFGAGHSVDTVREALRAAGLELMASPH